MRRSRLLVRYLYQIYGEGKMEHQIRDIVVIPGVLLRNLPHNYSYLLMHSWDTSLQSCKKQGRSNHRKVLRPIRRQEIQKSLVYSV